MPYIDQESRDKIENSLNTLIGEINYNFDDVDGVLNYTISRIVAEVMNDGPVWSYKKIARAVAVFECAKLEFYRRIAAPKEDVAIKTNGDIKPYRTQ